MSRIKGRTALLLVDFQTGLQEDQFWGGNRNNPDAEEKAEVLLNAWREKKMPVYHAKHSSTNVNSLLHIKKPGFKTIETLKPVGAEPMYVKQVNSAFIGTDLEQDLKSDYISSLVIMGLTTNHCISTTVRMAANLGFETFVVSDATATFDRTAPDGQVFSSDVVHAVSLASLHEEFASVLSTDEVLEQIRLL